MIKKIIFLSFVLLFSAIHLFAQTEGKKTIYCEFRIFLPFYSTKFVVFADFGNKNAFHKLRDEKGKVLKFESHIEVLNYMAEDGWVFVQTYTIGNTQYYLMKKEIFISNNTKKKDK